MIVSSAHRDNHAPSRARDRSCKRSHRRHDATGRDIDDDQLSNVDADDDNEMDNFLAEMRREVGLE